MNKKYISILSIMIILCGLSIAGSYIFYSKTKSIKSELANLNTEVQTLTAQSNRLTTLRQVANTTSDDLQVLQGFFIQKDGALDFVKYVEGLANSSGLEFRIDTVDEVVDPVLTPQNKVWLRMTVRVTGSLRRVRLFLSLIESLPYNIKIQRADLRKAGEAWSLVIDLSAVKEAEVKK